MNTGIKALAERVFDVLVIGGGLAGASVARDCAMRRLSVLLVERGNVGGGWTDILTGMFLPRMGLLHDNRDYLRDLSTEVGVHLGIAPNLMEALPVLYPLPKGSSLGEQNRRRALISAYDRFRAWKGTHTHIELSSKHLPLLDAALDKDIHRLFAWDEWHIDPARLCIGILKSAEACGAVIAQGLSAEKIQTHNDRIAGAWVKFADGTRLVRSRVVINAAGVEARKFYPGNSPLHRGKYQGGVTAVWERRLGTYAIALDPFEESGEMFLPKGYHQVFGVQKFDLPNARIDAALLDTMYGRITEKLADVYPTLSRHRLLDLRAAVCWQPIEPPAQKSSQSNGERFHDHAPERFHGLYSLLPHAEIEARLVAEKLTDRVCGFLRHRETSRTHLELLPGCTADDSSEFMPPADASSATADSMTFKGIVNRHGHHAAAIHELTRQHPELATVVCECEQITAAELRFCKDREWGTTTAALQTRTGAGRGNCDGARCSAWLEMMTGTPPLKRHGPIRANQLAGREYAAFMQGFSKGTNSEPTADVPKGPTQEAGA